MAAMRWCLICVERSKSNEFCPPIVFVSPGFIYVNLNLHRRFPLWRVGDHANVGLFIETVNLSGRRMCKPTTEGVKRRVTQELSPELY